MKELDEFEKANPKVNPTTAWATAMRWRHLGPVWTRLVRQGPHPDGMHTALTSLSICRPTSWWRTWTTPRPVPRRPACLPDDPDKATPGGLKQIKALMSRGRQDLQGPSSSSHHRPCKGRPRKRAAPCRARTDPPFGYG